MAHLLVLLERTPYGLHPASATGLCLARDIADAKGASVTAICPGDAGERDQEIRDQSGTLGADQLFFLGPQGFGKLLARLEPKHIFIPWTVPSRLCYAETEFHPLRLHWIDDPTRSPESASLPRALGIIAGSLPWQNCPDPVEAEYDGTAADIELPAWIKQTPSTNSGAKLSYFCSQAPDEATQALLSTLGATPFETSGNHEGNETLLVLRDSSSELPDFVKDRRANLRVIYLAGPQATAVDDWQFADWVLPGSWTEALRELQGQPWRTQLG